MKPVSGLAVLVAFGATLAASSVINAYLYIYGYPYIIRSRRHSFGSHRFLFARGAAPPHAVAELPRQGTSKGPKPGPLPLTRFH